MTSDLIISPEAATVAARLLPGVVTGAVTNTLHATHRLSLCPLSLSPLPGVVTTQLDIVTLNLGLDRVVSAGPGVTLAMVPVP